MTSFFVKSSFPKVVFGNLLLLISIALFIATTDPRQKHSGMTANDNGNNNTKTLHKKSPGLNRGLLYPPNKTNFLMRFEKGLRFLARFNLTRPLCLAYAV